MIALWLLRLALVVAGFFVGSWAMFLLLFTFTRDQQLFDFLMPIAGVAAAALAYFKTKPLTGSPTDSEQEVRRGA